MPSRLAYIHQDPPIEPGMLSASPVPHGSMQKGWGGYLNKTHYWEPNVAIHVWPLFLIIALLLSSSWNPLLSMTSVSDAHPCRLLHSLHPYTTFLELFFVSWPKGKGVSQVRNRCGDVSSFWAKVLTSWPDVLRKQLTGTFPSPFFFVLQCAGVMLHSVYTWQRCSYPTIFGEKLA